MYDFRDGDYRAICDLSGGKYWRSEMLYRWDGILVYWKFWTPYPEYLLTPRVEESIATPDARPTPPNIFIDPPHNPYGDRGRFNN